VTGEIGIQSASRRRGEHNFIGAAFREGMTPAACAITKVYVRGFDVRTGKRLWFFHTIPKKGEFGYDTWEKDSAEYTGNTGVWTQINVDEQLGSPICRSKSPTSDFYGGHRPGNQSFRRDAGLRGPKTGDAVAFPACPPSVVDMDISSAPILLRTLP